MEKPVDMVEIQVWRIYDICFGWFDSMMHSLQQGRDNCLGIRGDCVTENRIS